MSSAIRVVILGIGSVGSGIVQTLQNRKGIEIVGAIVAYFIMKEFVFSALGSAAGSATNFLSNIL